MKDENDLISNEKPQRLKDKIMEFIKKLLKKQSNSELNTKSNSGLNLS